MSYLSRIADKTGALGSIVSAMSCPACFPALASLGAALGLGFLSEYEGLFITTLMPIFAGVALLANAFGWFRYRQWQRSALGMIGPAIVLAVTLFFMGNWWVADLLYVGLAFMVGTSIWDFISRKNRTCTAATCATSSCLSQDPAKASEQNIARQHP